MKCPECGSDSFLPESGCLACGYMPQALRPTVPEAGEDLDMPLETLNRMLTQLGVEPLSDPERNAPEEISMDDGLLPQPPVLSQDSMEEASPDIREWSVVRAPLPAPVLPGKRLRDKRYVAAPLHALTTTCRRFAGWLGEIPLVLAKGWKILQHHILVSVNRKKPDNAMPMQASEASLALESDSVQLKPELNRQTQPTPLEEVVATPGNKPLREKKPLPQAVFWIGVPLLAILATICLLVGVLYLRELRQAKGSSPRDNPQEEPQGWTYVPWMPSEEPSPAPFTVVGE